MILITKPIILQTQKSTVRTVAYSIFTSLGVGVTILPFILSRTLDLNTILWFIIFGVVFGIPFAYIIGIRNLIKTIKVETCLANGDYYILVDKITNLYAIGSYSGNSSSDRQLSLLRYTEQTNKNVCVSYSTFRSVKEGDQCILVLCKGYKTPISVFCGNEYAVDRSLSDKII